MKTIAIILHVISLFITAILFFFDQWGGFIICSAIILFQFYFIRELFKK